MSWRTKLLIDGLQDIWAAIRFFARLLAQALFPRADEVKDNPVINEPEKPKPDLIPKAQILYDTAFKAFKDNKDVSPLDKAPDHLACVESLEEVFKRAFGHYIGHTSAPALNTNVLVFKCENSPEFEEVTNLMLGDIVVAVTHLGTHGHAAIMGKVNLLSNSSVTGKWAADYTFPTFSAYFRDKLKLKIRIFRLRG